MNYYPIFVGMNRHTAALHSVAFGFVATLPGLANPARLRCLDLAGDYEYITTNGSPYTVAHGSDRLALVDLANLGAAVPDQLRQFLRVRAGL